MSSIRRSVGFALLLGGCAVGGAPFQSPESVPTGKALVYFYRPPDLQGSAAQLGISDKDAPLTALKNGQFVALPIDAGPHSFTTAMTMDRPVTLDAVSGETYYIRFSLQKGAMTNKGILMRVYPDDALPELRDCCKCGSDLTERMKY